ncbi:MAG: hypothetical protein AAFY71_14315 [Bacteroidota bacterium]
MDPKDPQPKQEYAKRIKQAFELIKNEAWHKKTGFTANKLIEALAEMGHKISGPSLSRALNEEEKLKISLLQKISDSLDAYLEKNGPYVYNNKSENYEKLKLLGSVVDKGVSNSGLHTTFNRFPIEAVKKAIKSAQIEILFLQSFFSFLKEIKEDLKDALTAGVKVKILIPTSKNRWLELRKTQLSPPEADQLLHSSEGNHEIFHYLSAFTEKDNFQIRHFEDKGSSLNMVLIDNWIFQGYYWREIGFTEGPVELRTKGSLMGNQLIRHFQGLWAEGQEWTYKKNPKKRKLTREPYQGKDGNTESFYFRCFYYHRMQTRQFILKTHPADKNGSFSAEIIYSESKSHYIGNFKTYSSEISQTVAGVLEEKGEGGLCKFAFISLQLDSEHSILSQRRFIFGNISTQDTINDVLISSNIIFIKMDSFEMNDGITFIPLEQVEKRVGLSKSFIRTHIQHNYREQSMGADILPNLLHDYNRNSLDKRNILKDLAGTYELFSIAKEKNKLRKGWLKIEQNSVLWMPGRAGLDVRGVSQPNFSDPLKIFQCNVEVIGKDHIFIRTDSLLGGVKFFAVLKHSPIDEGVLTGTYTGIKRKLTDGVPLEPRGGRIVAIRAEKDEEDEQKAEEQNERLLQKLASGEDTHEVYSEELEEFDWFDPQKRIELKKRWEPIIDFFGGLNNKYIEDSKSLVSGRNWIRYHAGDGLNELAGKYYYYYKSSAENERGGIRKLMMEIFQNGEVKIMEKMGSILEGMAIRYGNHILIRQFQQETAWPNSHTPGINENKEEHFQGLFSLYVDQNKKNEESTQKPLLTGLILEYSRTKEPLARKVYLIPIEDSSIPIQRANPQVVTLGKNLEAYPERELNILKYIKNDPFYYIKTRKNLRIEEYQQEAKAEILCEACFLAALYAFKEKKVVTCIRFLEIGVQFGLTKDHERFKESLEDENGLKSIASMIDPLFY